MRLAGPTKSLTFSRASVLPSSVKLRVGVELMPTSGTFWIKVPSGLPGWRPSCLKRSTRKATVFSSPAEPGARPSNSSAESVLVSARMLAAEIAGAGAARSRPGSRAANAKTRSLRCERDVIIVAGPEGVLFPAANRRAEEEVFGVKVEWYDRQRVEQAAFGVSELPGGHEVVVASVMPARVVVGVAGGQAFQQVGG